MSGQTPVWKKNIQMTTSKMRSRSPNHSQIFASCHLCKLVVSKIAIHIEIVLTLLGVKTIATNANSNVNVIACFM